MVAERLRLLVLFADAAPCPRLSMIRADGRAAVADGRALQKCEGVIPRLVELRAELPVEPVSRRITQLTFQQGIMSVYPLDDDIASGQLIVNSHEYTLFFTFFMAFLEI